MGSKKRWDEHWKRISKKSSLFGKIVEIDRKMIIAESVKHYLNKYFPSKGVFVECGSGTSQTSIKIDKKDRKLIALDLSLKALRKSKEIEKNDILINGDILYLPIKDSSVDGIWNLGVMEHFDKANIKNIMNEFYRVVKKGSRIILFWPPKFGSSHIILRPIEYFYNLIFGKDFSFFPDEPSKLNSKREAENLIRSSKFKLIKIHFDHRDLFTNFVVVCEK